MAIMNATPDSPTKPLPVRLSLDATQGPLHIERMALGQGGLSSEPMWDSRVAEIKALRPAMIRVFIQEYFDLLPSRWRYHFDTLDRTIDTIVRTGASPLMCICFKPELLFPKVDQTIVEPTDYQQWEDLVAALVRHYGERHPGKVKYWEVGNEVDIGESGGCPYLFQPDSYVRYYHHTVDAILRADPSARVGGPAVASVRSPILPALMAAADAEKLPLHFISWHIYSSSPEAIRETIEFAKSLLAKHPTLNPETILNEWNMDLMNPPLAPAFQPCYVIETVWQMKVAGLDWSCYYHIRDYHLDYNEVAPFFSPEGAAFFARWWNRMPQADGLFDFQNRVRPAYFAFKLLSRLTGDRLNLDIAASAVHGFATHDDRERIYNLLLWNFSDAPVDIELSVDGLPGPMLMRRITLDSNAPCDDENSRLRPEVPAKIPHAPYAQKLRLEPYDIRFWSFE